MKVSSSCFLLHPDDCDRPGSRNEDLKLQRVLLSDYAGLQLEPGQHWRWRVRLNRPHGFANPGSSDYELRMMQRGIGARGYVRETPFNRLLGREGFSLSGMYRDLRLSLLQTLSTATAQLEHGGIMVALVMGEGGGIPDASWDLFRQTGTIHLLVISGLHVGFVALLCHGLVNLLARCFPGLLKRIPAQQLASLGAIAGALLYSLLAGFSLPTRRAVIMVSVFMGARLLARNIPVSLGYCLALTLVLVLEPLAIMSAGFWLSFVAVGVLLLSFSCRERERDLPPAAESLRARLWLRLRSALSWSAWGRPQWVVFVGMSVPLAMWLQEMSLLSPLANIVAIPLVSLLVVPLCLLASLLLAVHELPAQWLLLAADRSLAAVIALLEWLVGKLNVLSVWEFSGVSLSASLLAATGSVLLLMPRGWPGRYLGPVLMLPLFFPVRMGTPAQGELRLSVLDVGQGLAVVMQTAGHVLVYDAGPGQAGGFDAARAVVLPFLRARGIDAVERIIISHGDNDHAGGLATLLEAYPDAQLLLGSPLQEDIQPAGAQVCETGLSWQWDGVDFQMLHPPPGSRHARRNDQSCVLRIASPWGSVLLTGDIEALVERELLHTSANYLRSDVLLAPHHGSNTSSTQHFIEAVAPAVVVYSAGYRNAFGHPAAAVQARYQAAGVTAFDTASHGMVDFWFGEGPQPLLPEAYRDARRRYWAARP